MAKVKDLTGRRFGRLVVLNEEGRNSWGEAMWHCRCDCGNEIITAGRYLRNGDTRSCGCLKAEREILKPEDLSGQRFGRLIAVSRVGKKWLCMCDCGNTCEVYPDKLKSGHTQSCGCYQREQAAKAEVMVRGWKRTNVSLLRSKKAHSNTGVKGVSRIAKTGLYAVDIFAQGARTYVGKFHSLDAAIKARKRAEEKLHAPLIEAYEREVEGCAETKDGALPEEPAGRKQK